MDFETNSDLKGSQVFLVIFALAMTGIVLFFVWKKMDFSNKTEILPDVTKDKQVATPLTEEDLEEALKVKPEISEKDSTTKESSQTYGNIPSATLKEAREKNPDRSVKPLTDSDFGEAMLKKGQQ